MALTFLLTLACATTGGLQDRGVGPSTTTAELLARAVEPRRRALVVGVDEYADPAVPDLRFAGADATAMAERFRDAGTGGFDEVRVVGPAVDRDELLRVLAHMGADLRREDELVVYFSGHGTRVRSDDGWARYLLVSDSHPTDLPGTAVELDALQDWFSSLAPVRKALVLDACFHGEGRSVSASPGEDPQAGLGASPRPVRMAAGEAHLYATSPGRPAREDDALGHGVYTWYLLEAMAWGFPKADLDGDGVLTAYEAHDHARGRTIQHTEGVQVPEAAFRVIGEGDLALAGRPGAKARRERALIYLYDTPVADLEVRIDGRDRGLLPGALPVSPGRHQVTVEDAEGREVVAGHMRFEQGRAYTLAEVQRLARGPRLDVSMAAVSLRAPGELGASLGPGALGVELQGSVRDAEDPGRGLTGGLRLGLARAPQREVQDQLVLAPRPVYTLGAQAAWQGDWRRLRLRAGWGLGAVWAPPSPLAGELPQDADPYALPSEAGWWFLETGPDLAVGWVLGENLTLTAQARPHATWLDVTGGGQPHLLGWHVFTLGLAADW